MKCKNCGTEISDSDSFCLNCGTKIDNAQDDDIPYDSTVSLSNGVDLSKPTDTIEAAETPEESEAAETPEESEAAETSEESEAAETSEESEAAETPEESEATDIPEESEAEAIPENAHIQCSNCGADIASGDKFCQICGVAVGSGDDKKDAVGSSSMKCKACGAILNPGDRFCLMCGKPTDSVQTDATVPLSAVASPGLICNKCGSEIAPGDKFCQECGTPTGSDRSGTVLLPQAPVPAAPSVPRCTRCGGEIAPGERFCQKCGNPVLQPGFVPPAPESAYVAAGGFAPVNNTYGSNSQTKPDKVKKHKKSKAGKVILIIIIILLVLSLIAGGVLLFLYRDEIFGKDSGSDSTVSSETVSQDNENEQTSSAQAEETAVSSEETEEVSSEEVSSEEDIEVPYNSQIIKVNVEGDKATLSLEIFDETTGDWKEVMRTKACIGKNGATDYKVEGDKCTPKGTFDLNFVFGMKKPDTKLNFKQVKKNIVWIDDSDSDYYNTWQNDKASYKDWTKSKPVIKKFEQKLVTYRIAFNFNGDCLSKNSAESGRGSGLFIEGVGSKGKFKASYGDIRISSGDMKKLLKYLDSSKHPQVEIF